MVKLLVLGLMYGMIVVDEAMLQACPKGKELVLLQKAELVPKQKQEQVENSHLCHQINHVYYTKK